MVNHPTFYIAVVTSFLFLQIWLRILAVLPAAGRGRLGRTCSRYCRLVQDPALWREVVIDWQAIKKGGCEERVAAWTKLTKLTVTNRKFEQVKWENILKRYCKAIFGR